MNALFSAGLDRTRAPVGLMVNGSFGEAPSLKRGQQSSTDSGSSGFKADDGLVFVCSSSVPYGPSGIVLVDDREAMIGCLQRHRYGPFQGSIMA